MPESPLPAARLREKLERLMLFRVLMVTLLLGSAIVVNINDVESFADPSYIAIFTLIIGTYVATIFYAVLVTRLKALAALAHAQLVGDVLLAGGLVYVTGGTQSIFAFLFYLTIINSAILMGRKAAFITATLCSVTFLLMLSSQLGWVQIAWGPPLGRGVAANHVYSVIVNIVAYYLVGLLAGYLARRLEEQGSELERKQLDIRELQALNQHILSSITSGVVTLDTQKRILFLNRAAEELLGCTIKEIYGAPAAQMLVELSTAIESLLAPGGGERWEGWVDRAQSDPVFLSVSHSPLFDGKGEHYGHILTLQDLTLMHQMQRRVQRHERLAAVGQLAAAIAHEVRNPLASISGSVEMLQMFVDQGGDEDRLMRIVLREIDRLNILIGDFLDYARDRRRSFEPVQLDAIIGETLDLFLHDEKMAGGVVLRRDVEACKGLEIQANADGIKQIVWNLLRNASQAMDGKGEIVVRVKICIAERQPDGQWEALEDVDDPADGVVVRVTVSDSGPGISDDIRDRLFEPFFTTKRGGTGLGLATIYRIVEDHDGVIGVETSTEGTTFIIDLPIRRHPSEVPVESAPSMIPLARSWAEPTGEVLLRGAVAAVGQEAPVGRWK